MNSGTKRSKKDPLFELVFISLLREYYELEYLEHLGNKFDLEKLIDDLVLVSMFMGNDFLP